MLSGSVVAETRKFSFCRARKSGHWLAAGVIGGGHLEMVPALRVPKLSCAQIELRMPVGGADVKMARMPLIVAVLVGTGVAVHAQRAGERGTILSPTALQEIAQIEAEIDRIEAATLARLTAAPDNQPQQVELLGKAMLYDKQLSVNRNEACAFCHMPETGFTGPVSELNDLRVFAARSRRRKLRWTNAGMFGVGGAVWRFRSGRPVLRQMVSAQQLPLEGHDRGVTVVIGVFEMVDGVI
jgi:hypothetical protein